MAFSTVQLAMRQQQANIIVQQRFERHRHLLDRNHVGPADRMTKHEILTQVEQLPSWFRVRGRPHGDAMRGAGVILDWLASHPGDGWQDRWLVSGADASKDWIDKLAPDDDRSLQTKRYERLRGLAALLMCGAVAPSFEFIHLYHPHRLFDQLRAYRRPDVFARIEQAATERGLPAKPRGDVLTALCKIVLHTGRDVDALTRDDLIEAYVWSLRVSKSRYTFPGLHTGWDLLVSVGVLREQTSLRGEALHLGQRPTGELVDLYGVRCRPIRDLLVRYLDERRPAIDYNSFRNLVAVLAGRFWADIEQHHPGIDSLHLSDEVARAWKHRLQTHTDVDGNTRPRKDRYTILMSVRCLYLDIQQWALEDASWVPWVAPSPVKRDELKGQEKARKQTRSAMHQRVRQRLPHLPLLADTAERCHADAAALLRAAAACEPGEVFDHGSTRYRRAIRKIESKSARRQGYSVMCVENLANGAVINATTREDKFFWAWAIIETFRHTGVRLEELLEITHLALVSYQLSDTGETVPLLQIVPSKVNEERLLLVSPELASVLATIIKRLRSDGDGTVPLVARYDSYEKQTGPALPHLFQRRHGTRRSVISVGNVQKLINQVLDASGLKDAAGQTLTYTPHDFRRMFASEAVAAGLPVHIAARVLGHHTVTTTETYMAVFQDDLIRSYRAFLEDRRTVRPSEEYREPTDEEWREFQQHFQQRKVALGDCGRPYGASCHAEHSCIRCAMLRVVPRQRPRLIEIIRNLDDRITEARMNNWLGEVEGLKVSLDAAKRKLASLDRSIERSRRAHSAGPTDLGIPVVSE